MAIAEVLYTKKECFRVLDNGQIVMSKGKFQPSVALTYDVFDKPIRPRKGSIDIVERNIWGEEIYRENAEIHMWRLECERIDELNTAERKEQQKSLKNIFRMSENGIIFRKPYEKRRKAKIC